jgi:HK97 family phage prohead protease
MNIERRTFHNVEVRAVGTGPNGRPLITVQAIRPSVVDDYGSLWMADTFDEDVQGRMAKDPDDTPALCWSHNWADPIGHGVAYTPSADGPAVGFELDDFEAVPRAKQADAQVRSKTIRDCSVGFYGTERRDPTDEEKEQYPGIKEVIYRAQLDEVSLVLRGAVPGAKVLALRSGATVPEDAAFDLAKRVVAGEMTKDEAKVALELLATEDVPAPVVEGEPAPDHTALEAELDVALGRTARR